MIIAESIWQDRRWIQGIFSRKFSVVGNKTVSVGVAVYQAGDDAESIVFRADNALYSPKQQGKNRIVRTA